MSGNGHREINDAMDSLIEITADGSATLRSALHGDTYHSTRGAAGEARHVFIEAGFRQVASDPRFAADKTPVRIFEMGFGSGLNTWLTLEEAARTNRTVEYTAVELHPVAEDVAKKLNYTDDTRFMAMHRAAWGGWTTISEELPPSAFPRQPSADLRASVDELALPHGRARFRLKKLHTDAAEALSHTRDKYDLVYWDAFAPDTQPELWTPRIFKQIATAMSPQAVLVTYSSKGDVRRALQSAGFTVERLPGALGKRHMTRAIKNK
jgi:tRNA U34 5-methylaminomethyl-2-thiouridine-forming methyltransferase MnmC